MTHPRHLRVNIHPTGAAKRQLAIWPGLRAEVVQFTGQQPLEYDFRAPVHLLTVCERALRIDGETLIDGLPPSRLRNFGGKMCLVPAGRSFRGTYVPRLPPRTTYFYLDPAELPADPESRFKDVEFAPRLFFENAALWVTAAKLSALIANPGAESRLYAEALAAVLAIELVRLNRGAPTVLPPSRGHLAPWQRRMACDYIEEHLAEDVSLQELADLVRLSPTHFARVFKQTLSMPPHRYQIHCRIERAKRLLADSRRSVTEIALACGFSFPGNFSATFRKHAGLSPMEFRRTLD